MNFAKKQLEKYGWTDGKGLGKNEDGIKTAIKAKLKHNNSGIGHDPSEDFTNQWWHQAYNNASNSIEINTKKNGEVDQIIAKSKKLKHKNKRKNIESPYSTNFVKRATLTNGSLEKCENKINDSVLENDADFDLKPVIKNYTDEELFIACKGRTAHKGARHGLKLSGKLLRIQNQEKALLNQLKL